MSAAFTPGPWFVGAQNDALFVIDKPPRPDNDYPRHDFDVAAIAKVYHNGTPGVEEANARLCAAAPDLYAACKKVVEHYGDPAMGELFGLRAALAKADGKQG